MGSEFGDESVYSETNSKQTASAFNNTEVSFYSNWADGLADAEQLGDLSDVPPNYLHEVVELLRSLPRPGEDPGIIDHLRIWILTMKRLAGFSREVCLQLFWAITRLLEAPRPTKSYTEPSRVSLQQGFVRLSGVRETINVLLLRLNDEQVVAAACKVLCAAVQSSPLTVDFMLDSKPDDLRLLLRTIERHQACSEVAEAGCILICHLCAEPPVPEHRGVTHAPVRSMAHRTCQKTLAREGGAIELIVNILRISVETMKVETAKVEKTSAAAIAKAQSVALPKAGHKQPSSSVDRGNPALIQAWEELHARELVAGRVQTSALQAILLITFGNEETLRQLAGELWCGGIAAVAAEKAPSPEKKKEPKTGSKAGDHKVPHKGKRPGASKQHPVLGMNASPTPKIDELPQGEERCSLATMESMGKTSSLLADVILGRASLDRPLLAAQACRILVRLVERAIGLLEKVEAGRVKQFAEVFVKLRPGPIPEDSRKPEGSFAPLASLLAALTYAIRTHKDDVPLVSVVIQLMMKLKKFAFMAAPAGVEIGSEELQHAWQHLVDKAEENNELAECCHVLQAALDSTDAGNDRINHSMNATAHDLMGDGVWMSPRMRAFVANTALQSKELRGDVIASKWRNGEPGRIERRLHRDTPPVEEPDTTQRARPRPGDKRPGARGGPPSPQAKGSPQPGLKRTLSTPSRGATNAAETPDGSIPAPRRGPRGSTEIPRQLAEMLSSMDSPAKNASEAGKKKTEKKKEAAAEKIVEEEEPCEWDRAIGFGTHDEEDFRRLWETPLRETFQRSLSMPSIKEQRKEKQAILDRLRGTSKLAEAVDEMNEAWAEEERFKMEFIHSEPGLLKTQIIIQPKDYYQQQVTDLRLKNLTDANVASSEVTSSIAKTLKKSGVLLPKFGVQVVFKKGRRGSALANAGADLVDRSPSKLSSMSTTR